MDIVLLFTLSDRLLLPPVISGDCATVYPFWPATVTFCYKWRLCYCLSFLTAYCHPLLLMGLCYCLPFLTAYCYLLLSVEIVLLFTLSDRLMSPSVISGQCVIVYPFWPPTVITCYKWRLCYCLPFLTAYCYLLLSVDIVLLFTLSDRLMSPSVISGKCVIVYPFWSPTVTPVISGQCVTVYPYWPPTVTHCYKWRFCYCLPLLTAYCHPLL